MHLERMADIQFARLNTCRRIPPSARKGIPTLWQLQSGLFARFWLAHDYSIPLIRLPPARQTAI